MNRKLHLLLMGVFSLLLGISMAAVCVKEAVKKHTVVQGKIVDVEKRLGPGIGSRRNKGFTYTPVVEYKFGGSVYRIDHRISSPSPKLTYKPGDTVKLRVFDDTPDRAIIVSRKNLILPPLAAVFLIIIGAALTFISRFI